MPVKTPPAIAPKPIKPVGAPKDKGRKAAPLVPNRPVIYPRIEINGVEIPDAGLILTATLARDLLDWEDEDSYKARTKGTPDEAKGLAGFGDEYLLLDEHGRKVQCWNNAKNREFDEAHCRKLAQDVLAGEWRLNLETVIVGKSGLVLSGQHRLIALVLAAQMWRKAGNAGKWPAWPEGKEPYVRTLVAFGADEDIRTVRTLDNTKPRTDADTIYTSGIFDSLNQVGKKECSRMLAAETEFLWKRTGAGENADGKVYQSHSASGSWRERHPKLLECVKHVFEENTDRPISKLKLSAGMIAGAMYLMGSSESNQADYYDTTGKDPLPGEKKLVFTRKDLAEEFVTLLASNTPDLEDAREQIRLLVDADDITGGRHTEKMVVLAKAWEAFVARGAVTAADVDMTDAWGERGGMRVLTDETGFGGVDLGPQLKKVRDDGASPADRDAAKAAIRAEHAEEMKARVGGGKSAKAVVAEPKDDRTAIERLTDLKLAHPGRILLVELPDRWKAWGNDAQTVAPKAKSLIKHEKGMYSCEFSPDKFDAVVAKLQADGHKVATVSGGDAAPIVTDLVPEPPAKK